jgi:uncharacterized protein (DUF952 family)
MRSKNALFHALSLSLFCGTITLGLPKEDSEKVKSKHPFVFHLVQKSLWDDAVENNVTYFPPTYHQDGFTHATANPIYLTTIGNHFYQDVEGDWLCLKMSLASLSQTGVDTIFEGTAPVGDKEANFEGSDSELFPHILGGIHPSSVLEALAVNRDHDGRFLSIEGLTEGAE